MGQVAISHFHLTTCTITKAHLPDEQVSGLATHFLWWDLTMAGNVPQCLNYYNHTHRCLVPTHAHSLLVTLCSLPPFRPCSALASCFTAQILSPCAGTRGSIDTHTKGTGFPESSRFLDRWLEPVFDVEVVECIEHFSQGLHVRSTISKELPPVVRVLEVLG